jgi:hypothetical protein
MSLRSHLGVRDIWKLPASGFGTIGPTFLTASRVEIFVGPCSVDQEERPAALLLSTGSLYIFCPGDLKASTKPMDPEIDIYGVTL